MPAADGLASHPGLLAVLQRARQLGFTGQADPAEQIAHATRFLAAIADPAVEVPAGAPGPHGVDLGSGAGLPGLVLAVALPASTWVLVEAMERRAGPLTEAISALGLEARVEVWVGRAEDYAREPGRRGASDLVTARGFGPPAVTAECGAPLLRPNGILLVSEPPGSSGERWDSPALADLGLTPVGVVAGVMACQASSQCPETYPRRAGRPAKRPLF